MTTLESLIANCEHETAVYVSFRAQIGPTPQGLALLRTASATARSRTQRQQAAQQKDRERFRTAHLAPLLDAGRLEMTIPDNPRSSRQQYRTTAAGFRLLQEKGSS